MTIYERFIEVLEDRLENPWAKSLGVDRSAVFRMKKDNKAPDWPPLSIIRKAERVNLGWLIEGKGEPFEVNRHLSDDECAETIACLLHDEPWTVVIASAEPRLAIVVHQPAQDIIHGRAKRETPSNYTLCEIHLGGGPATLAAIASKAQEIRLKTITNKEMEAIYQGQAGTYRLLLAADAWLRDAHPIAADHPIFAPQEQAPRYLSREEEIILQCFAAMEPAQRETYKAIGDTLAQQDRLKKDAG